MAIQNFGWPLFDSAEFVHLTQFFSGSEQRFDDGKGRANRIAAHEISQNARNDR